MLGKREKCLIFGFFYDHNIHENFGLSRVENVTFSLLLCYFFFLQSCSDFRIGFQEKI